MLCIDNTISHQNHHTDFSFKTKTTKAGSSTNTSMAGNTSEQISKLLRRPLLTPMEVRQTEESQDAKTLEPKKLGQIIQSFRSPQPVQTLPAPLDSKMKMVVSMHSTMKIIKLCKSLPEGNKKRALRICNLICGNLVFISSGHWFEN